MLFAIYRGVSSVHLKIELIYLNISLSPSFLCAYMTDNLIFFICLHWGICKKGRTLGQQVHVVYFAGVPGPTLGQLALRLSGCFVNKRDSYGDAWVFKYCIYEEHL